MDAKRANPTRAYARPRKRLRGRWRRSWSRNTARAFTSAALPDPAIWDRSRGTSVEEQIRHVFSGVTFIKGDNTRLAGKMQIHNRLRFDEDGRPMMYIFENCRDFRRTIPTLCYDAHKVEDIDTAGEDHIYDETRYFLMSRPIAARQPVQPPEEGMEPAGVTEKERKATKE